MKYAKCLERYSGKLSRVVVGRIWGAEFEYRVDLLIWSRITKWSIKGLLFSRNSPNDDSQKVLANHSVNRKGPFWWIQILLLKGMPAFFLQIKNSRKSATSNKCMVNAISLYYQLCSHCTIYITTKESFWFSAIYNKIINHIDIDIFLLYTKVCALSKSL